MNKITPIRQFGRLYDSILSISTSLAKLANLPSAKDSFDELKKQVAANNQELARIIAEAVKPAKKDIDLYDRYEMRLLLDKASPVDRLIIDGKAWEPEQTIFFMDLLAKFFGEPKLIFVDVGAYWGLYSLLAMRSGVQTIYAFEPDRHNFAQLEAQIFLNNASSFIRPINKAVSSATREFRFWDSRTHPDGNRAGVGIAPEDFPRPTYKVDAVSLDEFLAVKDSVIAIKLDVEGHETEALRGMANTVKNNRVIMQIEVFDCNYNKFLPVLETFDLREIKRISPDRYYTNIPADRLWI